MWCALVLCSFLANILVETEGVPRNTTGLLISRYAKVSHYSTSGNEKEDGKNDTRKIASNHRYDTPSTGRDIGNGPVRVAYQFPVYTKPTSKKDSQKVEALPAVGEVIQDRFQGKPYFEYGKIPPKNEASATFAPAKPVTAAPVRQAPPPVPSSNSFPAVFNVAPVSSKPPVDLYTSPYSSYNPPPQQPDDSSSDSYAAPQDSYAAPPDSYAAPADSYAAPPDSYAAPPESDGKGPYKSNSKMGASTFGPPLAPSDSDSEDMDQKDVDAPPSDYSHSYQDDGPPDYPPKSEDDIYYPPGVPHDDAPEPAGPMDMMDHPKDLGTVSGPIVEHGAHFPQYLYNDHHFDHNVYEEIPHTTPAPVKEDKRVSTTHYSYYYLGRKLWYIPLYFSIYFMVYVTVLILKSIARHKVEIKHDWVVGHSRSGKEMTYDKIEALDNFHKNVTQAIDRVSRSYSNMAMK